MTRGWRVDVKESCLIVAAQAHIARIRLAQRWLMVNLSRIMLYLDRKRRKLEKLKNESPR